MKELSNEDLAYSLESMAMGKRALVSGSGTSYDRSAPSRYRVAHQDAAKLDEAARRLREMEVSRV